MGFYTLESGKTLSKRNFVKYFERKVFKTILDYKLITRRDRLIAIAASGGKDSSAALVALKHFAEKYKFGFNIKIVAVAIDEGIPNYRDKLIKNLQELTQQLDIPLKVYSFKEELGVTLAKLKPKIAKLGLTCCYVCSIFKRSLLNSKLNQLKADKVATGHCIDDEAETILLNQLKGNAMLLAKLGPKTGITELPGFVQRIKPLYFVTTREVIAYNKALNLPLWLEACPYRPETLRVKTRNFLTQLEKQHPEVKRAIVNSFIEILPILKKHYGKQLKQQDKRITKCEYCGQPATAKICKACLLKEELGID